MREDKRGTISEDTPPILEQLSVQPETWARTTSHFGTWTYVAVGTIESLKANARRMGRRWFKGTALDQSLA